jgi:hypothetical protein
VNSKQRTVPQRERLFIGGPTRINAVHDGRRQLSMASRLRGSAVMRPATSVTTAIGVLSLALATSLASAQGTGGGGGGAGGGTAGGSGASGGTGVGGPGAVTRGAIGTVQPGVVPPVTPGAVAPGRLTPLAVPPGAVIQGAPSPGTAVQPQTGVGQPTTATSQPGDVTQPQIGAAGGSQPTVPNGAPDGGGAAGDAAQTADGAGGGGQFPSTIPSTVSPTVPPGASPTPTTQSGSTGAVPASRAPLLITAPPSARTAPVTSAMTATIPPDAVGVVVESMMLADVTDVDTARGCVTVRTLSGESASYRIENPADAKVAVGDTAVIEVARPLFASAGDAPSASPTMVEPRTPTRGGASSVVSSAQPEKTTTISTAARATVIARDAVRCATR